MYSRKLFKVGNSLAITLPASYIKSAGIKIGDRFSIDVDSKTKTALIQPHTNSFMKYLTPQFFRWLAQQKYVGSKKLKW